ncbi:MAG: aspartate ammonia-lyase [Candidatus Omnitrophica bacterium]|nr:aspartate ammonia-lyase [Candidatus Omnitrophota bacterium]
MSERLEKDSLGEKTIPSDAYWGIHTKRALENFSISCLKVNPSLIKAMATVKKTCALTNQELGCLPLEKSKAIMMACDEIIDGKLSDQFPLDALQGGAGTSTNMNVNEVIANRAIEILGGQKGNYGLVHPIEDVNLNQSTNDVYPTALKVACISMLRVLAAEIARLQGAFQKKEKEFAEIVKIGRTELQEAVPMTLGQEFSAFAEAIGRDRWRTFKCEERLRVVNLGGTAIGTGISAPKSYIFGVIEKLREITGMGLMRGENLVDATANADSFVEISGILKAHAVNLIKISNDLRLLNLLGEIKLPAVQVGSSIMAGKINPVILESVIQSGYKVIANDALVTEAAAKGSLQINEFLPLLAHAILESLDILTAINGIFANHVDGIKADEQKCLDYLNKSPQIITAFLPYIGYDKAADLLKEFQSSGKDNLRAFLNEKLGVEAVDKVLSIERLISLGYKDRKSIS